MAPKMLASGQAAQNNGQQQQPSSTTGQAKGTRVKKVKRHPLAQATTTTTANNNELNTTNRQQQQQQDQENKLPVGTQNPQPTNATTSTTTTTTTMTTNTKETKEMLQSNALLAPAKPIITASRELTAKTSAAKNMNNIDSNVNTDDGLKTAYVNTFDSPKTSATSNKIATTTATQKQQVQPATATKMTSNNKYNQISSVETLAAAAGVVASPAIKTSSIIVTTTPKTTTTTTTTSIEQQESTPTRNMINSNSDNNKSPSITMPAIKAPLVATSQQQQATTAAVVGDAVEQNEATLNALINNMMTTTNNNNDNISDCVSVTSKSSSARISTIDPEEGVKIDTSRVQRRFSSQNSQEESSTCKICSKHVYQMERMMAEKNVYHKQCFRCAECKIQLRMDNYSSHESQLYCKAHHRQLFQPKAKFDEDNDVEPVTKSTKVDSDGAAKPTTKKSSQFKVFNLQQLGQSTSPQIDEYLLHRGQLSALSYDSNNNQGGRWKQMVICENEPAELPKDVVRCETKVDDGIEGLNLNLSNIRERFEQQANESHHQKSVSSSTPIIDKPSISIKQKLANFDLKLQQQNSFDYSSSSNNNNQQAGMLSSTAPAASSTNGCHSASVCRSESLMMRLKKYESVISGEKNDDDDNSSGNEDNQSSTNTSGDVDNNGSTALDQPDVASVDLSSLKQKWETGHVNKSKESLAHEHKEILTKVRQSLALGRNQSVKNIYEKAVKEAVSTKPIKSESVVLNFPSKANSLKEKFELGLVNDTGDSDTDEPTKLDQLRQEKMNDLSVFDEGEISAREARNLFKQIDRRLSSASAHHQQQSFDGTNLSHNNNNGETNGYQSLGSKGALINGTVTAAARRRFERQPVRCNTVADIGDNNNGQPIEIVKCSQPGAKEDISVETTRLREKFNFFENYREEPKTPRRFEMTPPREIVANGRKYSTVTNSDSSDEDDASNHHQITMTNGTGTTTRLSRKTKKSSSNRSLVNGGFHNGAVVDSNNNSNSLTTDNNEDGIIKCSITTKLDDVPKTDTTRRMLDKFKQLQENGNNSSSSSGATNQPIYIGNINTNINLIKQNLLSPASAEQTKADGGRPCLKRITPPRDYTLDNDSSDDDDNHSDIQQRDPNIIRCADKLDDQIQVEPEKARSLRMKFENWAANQTSLDSDDNNNNINGNYDGTNKNGDNQQFVPSVDTTRNLKAKFEAFGREENLRPVTIPRPQARVNRFVVKDMAE